MTKEEALKERPCNKCVHKIRCQVVDYIYSPCYETDKNGDDYHGAFDLDRTYGIEQEAES